MLALVVSVRQQERTLALLWSTTSTTLIVIVLTIFVLAVLKLT